MLELEFGVVKHFDDHDGKKFGFLEVLNEDDMKTGEEIFFHFNDGEFVDVVDGDITFVGRAFTATGARMWVPNVGDNIAFLRTTGKGDRPKASPWTYALSYMRLVLTLTAPYFQVVQITNGNDGRENRKMVFWQGQGSDELSSAFPIRVLDRKLNDPLADSVSWGEGSTVRYVFERWEGTDPVVDEEGRKIFDDGHWVPCDDPRYVSDAAKALRNPLSAHR